MAMIAFSSALLIWREAKRKGFHGSCEVFITLMVPIFSYLHYKQSESLLLWSRVIDLFATWNTFEILNTAHTNVLHFHLSNIMKQNTLKMQLFELRMLWANKRQLLRQALKLAMIVCSALLIWKGLVLFTKSETPVVVVASGIGGFDVFARGDILLLHNATKQVRVGDLVAFQLPGRQFTVVHRIVTVHETSDGVGQFLTKGDTNRLDDRGLYEPNQLWLERQAINGRVVATLPYFGMVTILLKEYPIVACLLVGKMMWFLLTHAV